MKSAGQQLTDVFGEDRILEAVRGLIRVRKDRFGREKQHEEENGNIIGYAVCRARFDACGRRLRLE